MFSKVTMKWQHNRRWFKMMAMMTTSNMLVMLLTTLPLLLNDLACASTLAEREINNLNSKETTNSSKNVGAAVRQTKVEIGQYPFNGIMVLPPPPFTPSLPGCPLCDSSVYSYCSHKLLHDSCCCDFPGIYQKPPQCVHYDCALLYAKSCYEHSLIKNCCCNNPY